MALMDGFLSYLDKDKQWQRRRYVLDNTQFTRYPETAPAPRDAVPDPLATLETMLSKHWSLRISDLSRVSVVRKEKKKRPVYGVAIREAELVFLLECHSGRVYLVKAESEEQMNNWVGAIREAILQKQSTPANGSNANHSSSRSIETKEPAISHRHAVRDIAQMAQLESQCRMHQPYSLVHQMLQMKGYQLDDPPPLTSATEETSEGVVVRITDAPNVNLHRVRCKTVPPSITKRQLHARISEVEEEPEHHPTSPDRYSEPSSPVK